MTDCLVITFRAPNGLALNPQTVEAIERCVIDDRSLPVWQQMEAIRERLETGCGQWQVDAVDENPVDGWEPDFHNTWAKLQVGDVITDEWPYDLTATFSNLLARGTNCATPTTTTSTTVQEPTTTTTVQEPTTTTTADDSGLTVATVPDPTEPEPLAPAAPVSPPAALLVPLPTIPADTVPEPVYVPVGVAGVSATRVPQLAKTGAGLDIDATVASGIGSLLVGLSLVAAVSIRKFFRSKS